MTWRGSLYFEGEVSIVVVNGKVSMLLWGPSRFLLDEILKRISNSFISSHVVLDPWKVKKNYTLNDYVR